MRAVHSGGSSIGQKVGKIRGTWTPMNEYWQVQIDNNGAWLTVSTLPAQDTQKLLIELRSQKIAFPNKRVRAVDSAGRLVDLLP